MGYHYHSYQILPWVEDMSRGRLNEAKARVAFLNHYRRTGEALGWDALREAAGGGSNRDIQILREALMVESVQARRLDSILTDEMMDEFKLSLAKVLVAMNASNDEKLEAITVATAAKIDEEKTHSRTLAGLLDARDREVEELKSTNAQLIKRVDTLEAEREAFLKRAVEAETEARVLKMLIEPSAEPKSKAASTGRVSTQPKRGPTNTIATPRKIAASKSKRIKRRQRRTSTRSMPPGLPTPKGASGTLIRMIQLSKIG